MNNLTNQGTYYSMVMGCSGRNTEQVFFKPSFKFCDPEIFSPIFGSCNNGGGNVPPIEEEMVIIYDGGGVEGYN